MKWALGILLYSAVAALLLACGYQAGVRDTVAAVRIWAVEQGLAEMGETEAGAPLLIWRPGPEEPLPLPVYLKGLGGG